MTPSGLIEFLSTRLPFFVKIITVGFKPVIFLLSFLNADQHLPFCYKTIGACNTFNQCNFFDISQKLLWPFSLSLITFLFLC